MDDHIKAALSTTKKVSSYHYSFHESTPNPSILPFLLAPLSSTTLTHTDATNTISPTQKAIATGKLIPTVQENCTGDKSR